MSQPKPKILLVDDEPHVLEGLTRGLRNAFEVRTASSGAAGLDLLGREPDTAIVMSDVRMPLMPGTAFLAKARVITPDAVRILLTGQAEMEDAIAAINEGSIFRFLRKPCSPELMRSTLAAAMDQHRLIIAERQLLEQTLRGAVKALCDTLALANPGVFGMAMRVKRVASNLAEKVGGAELWQIEVAAMLCQLGAMTVPQEIFERRALGKELVPSEREMLDRIPIVTDQLLASIPRLEPVRDIVRHSRAGFDPTRVQADTRARTGFEVPLGARILRVALDFEELESAGLTSAQAIERMLARGALYDPIVVEALRGLHIGAVDTVVEVPIGKLREGMVIAADILAKNGTLLVARGHEVTPGLVRRLENFASSLATEKIAVAGDAKLQPVRRSAA